VQICSMHMWVGWRHISDLFYWPFGMNKQAPGPGPLQEGALLGKAGSLGA